MVLTLEEAVNLQMQECIDSTRDAYHPSVRAVLGAEEGNNPEYIGSCMLLCVDGRKIGVTAAHIIDKLDCRHLYVASTAGNQPAQILGEIVSTEMPAGGRNDDKLDFSFWEFSDVAVSALGQVDFVTSSAFFNNQLSPVDRSYMIMGYPLSKNKKNISNPDHTIKTTVTSYTGDGADPNLFQSELGVTAERNLLIEHGKYSTNFDGKKVNSFGIEGMSGGPIFDLGSFSSITNYESCSATVGKICGMLIEKHSKSNLIVGVKIQQVMAAISVHFAL